jgi:hypothetical protein
VSLVRKSDLAEAFSVARWFDSAALYIALLPVAAFALAVLFSPNRPRTLVYAGLLVVLTSGVRIAILESPLQSSIIDVALQDPTARDAANATYDVLAATLERIDVLVGAGGVAVAVVGFVLSIALFAARRNA